MGQSHPLVGWMDCAKSWRASLTEQGRLGSIRTSVEGLGCAVVRGQAGSTAKPEAEGCPPTCAVFDQGSGTGPRLHVP
jgi:hypothetical protein